MDLQISGEWVFNGMVSIAVTFVGFWLRSVKEELKELKSECKDIRNQYQTKELAKVQSTHTDSILAEIRDELKAMNHKLDKKVDK
ncbi:hypothetical protein [Gallibacterium sp. AGMB14963]|uniref:hypothetical protein n=1 Tax=Gallibacterium faecale TaxID=3019086 RepID=UPI0022F1BD4F|nr:hypothetical protein [Gallibacterium sp. AGMB14963]MDA3978474.1 hypothetical protein [Gallibacterium sp. AGMB14963]